MYIYIYIPVSQGILCRWDSRSSIIMVSQNMVEGSMEPCGMDFVWGGRVGSLRG